MKKRITLNVGYFLLALALMLVVFEYRSSIMSAWAATFQVSVLCLGALSLCAVTRQRQSTSNPTFVHSATLTRRLPLQSNLKALPILQQMQTVTAPAATNQAVVWYTLANNVSKATVIRIDKFRRPRQAVRISHPSNLLTSTS